jgi:hypothetical protein
MTNKKRKKTKPDAKSYDDTVLPQPLTKKAKIRDSSSISNAIPNKDDSAIFDQEKGRSFATEDAAMLNEIISYPGSSSTYLHPIIQSRDAEAVDAALNLRLSDSDVNKINVFSGNHPGLREDEKESSSNPEAISSEISSRRKNATNEPRVLLDVPAIDDSGLGNNLLEVQHRLDHSYENRCLEEMAKGRYKKAQRAAEAALRNKERAFLEFERAIKTVCEATFDMYGNKIAQLVEALAFKDKPKRQPKKSTTTTTTTTTTTSTAGTVDAVATAGMPKAKVGGRMSGTVKGSGKIGNANGGRCDAGEDDEPDLFPEFSEDLYMRELNATKIPVIRRKHIVQEFLRPAIPECGERSCVNDKFCVSVIQFQQLFVKEPLIFEKEWGLKADARTGRLLDERGKPFDGFPLREFLCPVTEKRRKRNFSSAMAEFLNGTDRRRGEDFDSGRAGFGKSAKKKKNALGSDKRKRDDAVKRRRRLRRGYQSDSSDERSAPRANNDDDDDDDDDEDDDNSSSSKSAGNDSRDVEIDSVEDEDDDDDDLESTKGIDERDALERRTAAIEAWLAKTTSEVNPPIRSYCILCHLRLRSELTMLFSSGSTISNPSTCILIQHHSNVFGEPGEYRAGYEINRGNSVCGLIGPALEYRVDNYLPASADVHHTVVLPYVDARGNDGDENREDDDDNDARGEFQVKEKKTRVLQWTESEALVCRASDAMKAPKNGT